MLYGCNESGRSKSSIIENYIYLSKVFSRTNFPVVWHFDPSVHTRGFIGSFGRKEVECRTKRSRYIKRLQLERYNYISINNYDLSISGHPCRDHFTWNTPWFFRLSGYNGYVWLAMGELILMGQNGIKFWIGFSRK